MFAINQSRLSSFENRNLFFRKSKFVFPEIEACFVFIFNRSLLFFNQSLFCENQSSSQLWPHTVRCLVPRAVKCGSGRLALVKMFRFFWCSIYRVILYIKNYRLQQLQLIEHSASSFPLTIFDFKSATWQKYMYHSLDRIFVLSFNEEKVLLVK